MAQVNNGTFGNVGIKAIPSHKPSHYQRLNWSNEHVIDTTYDDKLWLLNAAVEADFGYIDNGNYILFSDNSADELDPEPFYGFVSVTIPQNCEPDFDIAKGILDTLWELVVHGYEFGFRVGLEEQRILGE